MFCPNCGATNPDDAAFCRSCRQTISVPPPQPAAPGASEPWGSQSTLSAGEPQYLTYAAFWPRFGAYLLDLLFSTLIAAIPAVLLAILFAVLVASNQEEVFTQTQEDEQAEQIAYAIVGGFLVGYLPVYFAYHTIANAKGGGWGKRIVGLRVLRARDGALPGYGSGFLRTIAPSLIGFVPLVGGILQLIGYLSCIWDSQKQTWHDKIAGTVVVVGAT